MREETLLGSGPTCVLQRVDYSTQLDPGSTKSICSTSHPSLDRSRWDTMEPFSKRDGLCLVNEHDSFWMIVEFLYYQHASGQIRICLNEQPSCIIFVSNLTAVCYQLMLRGTNAILNSGHRQGRLSSRDLQIEETFLISIDFESIDQLTFSRMAELRWNEGKESLSYSTENFRTLTRNTDEVEGKEQEHQTFHDPCR